MMKTFQSKSLLESRTVSLLKGLTLLFLWASVAVLATQAALTIDPGVSNSTQYIQKVVLTSNGSANGSTGIVLDGSGDATFAGRLNVNGTGWISIYGRSAWVIPDFQMYSYDDIKFWVLWAYFSANNDGVYHTFSLLWLDWGSLGTLANTNILTWTTGGNVGIGTTSPMAKLDVNGSGKFNALAIRSNLDLLSRYITWSDFWGPFVRSYLNINNEVFIWSNKSALNNLFWLYKDDTTSIALFWQMLGTTTWYFFGNYSIFASTTGNIWIGTRAPTAKLDVAGNVKSDQLMLRTSTLWDCLTWTDAGKIQYIDNETLCGSGDYTCFMWCIAANDGWVYHYYWIRL
jgi:hypothetical protein